MAASITASRGSRVTWRHFCMLALCLGGIVLILSYTLTRDLAGYGIAINTSPSEPPGLYIYTPTDTIARHELVAFSLPSLPWLIVRHYVPTGELIIKQVAGMPGDYLFTQNRVIYRCPTSQLDAHCRPLGQCLPVDSSGRSLPCKDWHGHRIPPHYYYLRSNRVPAALDSRYFGLAPRQALLVTLHPVVTW